MASNQSTHFQLNLWEPGDNFLREEFNENFTKLDEAVAAGTRLTTGSYVGNGQATQTITLDFTPKAVLVLPAGGNFFSNGSPSYTNGGLAAGGSSAKKSEGTLVSICTGGFQIYFLRDYVGTNYSNQVFNFIAVG
ncbi:MAG: hypothetical protein VB096_06720 [Pseudoflavonifractor sp.]|nr:hypothetical protein [Pseudoflavonifractor sp.]